MWLSWGHGTDQGHKGDFVTVLASALGLFDFLTWVVAMPMSSLCS